MQGRTGQRDSRRLTMQHAYGATRAPVFSLSNEVLA